MSKEIVLRFFPEAFVQLQNELRHAHRDILDKMNTDQTMEEQLAVVATEVGVAVDGYYEVADLCEMLLRRLQNRERLRQGMIALPDHAGMQMIETKIEVEAKLNDAGKARLLAEQRPEVQIFDDVVDEETSNLREQLSLPQELLKPADS